MLRRTFALAAAIVAIFAASASAAGGGKRASLPSLRALLKVYGKPSRVYPARDAAGHIFTCFQFRASNGYLIACGFTGRSVKQSVKPKKPTPPGA